MLSLDVNDPQLEQGRSLDDTSLSVDVNHW